MLINRELTDSDTLIIAFTGYANKLHLPVDKFFVKAGLKPHNKIIICDKSKKQTLGGLPPRLPTFFDIVEYLEKEIDFISPKNLIITGTSGGGHPAILYGHLLKADKVVAFSPYPYLSIETATKMKDPALQSFKRILDIFDQLPEKEKDLLDLKNILKDWNQKTSYYLHVSKGHEWDHKRSMYMNDCPGVEIIKHPYKIHSIASALAKDNLLSKYFAL